MKKLHHCRSERTAHPSRIQRSLLRKAPSSSSSLRTKVRPGCATIAACWRWPSRHSRSCLLHAFLCSQSSTRSRIRRSFCGVNLTSIASVSSSNPRNTRKEVGPSHFPGAVGTPSLAQVPSIASRFAAQVSAPGGPIVI